MKKVLKRILSRPAGPTPACAPSAASGRGRRTRCRAPRTSARRAALRPSLIVSQRPKRSMIGLSRIDPERARGEIPDDVAEHRAGGAGGDHAASNSSLPLAAATPGDRHDDFGRDRREDRFQEHQEGDAEIARLLDQADDPVTHRSLGPRDLGFDRVPDQRRRVAAVELVDRDDAGRRGDVDLGQQCPPITSMPTNSSPRASARGRARRRFPARARSARSPAAVPPAARLERISPAARHAVDRAGDLAVDQHDALVALGTAGRNACAMNGSRHVRRTVRPARARLPPSRPIRNTAAPALPWSGFSTISPCFGVEGAQLGHASA